MQFTYGSDRITVFTISPRTKDVAQYWGNIENCIDWSSRYGATGILLFEGNDTYVSPWVAAQVAFERSETLCPLVAVNPIYMHPFSVAKLVNSYAQIYGRRTFLNMITGTALSYLQAMDDELAHDQRYERLGEYAQILWALLTTDGPVSESGQYHKINGLRLDPPTPENLLPEFFFAGGSDAATQTARRVNGTQMRMLPPELDDGITGAGVGLHFGIVTRDDEKPAWQAAARRFPEDRYGERVQALTMKNTDSVWKQRMFRALQMEESARPGYWLNPFKTFQADCPYFVGSHQQVAQLISRLVRSGARKFILDIPGHEEEFENVAAAFGAADALLA